MINITSTIKNFKKCMIIPIPHDSHKKLVMVLGFWVKKFWPELGQFFVALVRSGQPCMIGFGKFPLNITKLSIFSPWDQKNSHWIRSEISQVGLLLLRVMSGQGPFLQKNLHKTILATYPTVLQWKTTNLQPPSRYPFLPLIIPNVILSSSLPAYRHHSYTSS